MTSLAAAAAVAAAAVGVGSYLDAKHFIREDLVKAGALIAATLVVKSNDKKDRNSLYYVFEDQVRKRGQAEMYVCEGKSWSWKQVETESRKVAQYLVSVGVQKGDKLALFMSNKPAYVIIWLACLSLDVVPAFVNYNLVGAGLAHCIKSVTPTLILYDAPLHAAISDIIPNLNPSTILTAWFDLFTTDVSLEKVAESVKGTKLVTHEMLDQFSGERMPDSWRAGVKQGSPAMLIYTSGTSGLPKSVPCAHGRNLMAFYMWRAVPGFNNKSRIYTCMPLYHSTAAICAVGMAWLAGSTVIIGRKFSVNSFWDEVRASNADTIQYVGEIPRYLLAAPPSPTDKDHKVKLAYGNGLRPDVWQRFRERFGVDTIVEFFAATEGNGATFNKNHNALGAGAVGHDGTLASLKRKNDMVILRMDPDTDGPARDDKGLCVRAESNEIGELVMRIDASLPHMNFVGYHGAPAATQKKVLRDVLVKGDSYFRSGDLLSFDREGGYYYFHDRQGDTFRWKGENVATTQVAAALGEVINEANVYGVVVPGHDGRAGCAAIPTSSTPCTPATLDMLAKHVQKTLPKYAQPLFIRFVPSIEVTGTGKQLKGHFRDQGVDPDKITQGDAIYWLKQGQYVPFQRSDWDLLKSGKARL